MFAKINEADFYIGLWCLIGILGVIRLFDALSIVLLGIAFVVAMRYAIVLSDSWQNRYFQALNILIIVFTIYGFVYLFLGPTYDIGDGPVNKRTFLINIYKSLLPIYPFYYYSRKGLITEKSLKKWVLIFIVICILTFFKRAEETLMELRDHGSQREGYTNNSGYLMLYLLPCLAVYNSKKILQLILLVLIMVFVLVAMKRGAIIIAIPCILFMFKRHFSSFKYRTKLLFAVVLLLMIYVATDALLIYYSENAYFQERMESTLSGHTSGRDGILAMALDYWLNSAGIIKQIIGSGAESTLGAMGIYAHNDWIEILINQGILGVFVYFIYMTGLFYTWRKSKRNPNAYMALGLYGCIFFLRSFFSMSYSDVSIYATIVFAYYLAESHKIYNVQKITKYESASYNK